MCLSFFRWVRFVCRGDDFARESLTVSSSHWKDFAFSSPLRGQQQKRAVRGSVSSCLKLTFAKPKTRGREKTLLFSIKTSGINSMKVEELFRMMNNAGITKKWVSSAPNKFMMEIKKNYDWNEVLEQPSTGAEGTWAHLVLGWILLCSELFDVVVCSNWLDDSVMSDVPYPIISEFHSAQRMQLPWAM